ncbi:MAG: translation initiation factor IF-2 [Clostridia bacterium]|nr:translation initiation factor IF-2 [Clostridia bacterium]
MFPPQPSGGKGGKGKKSFDKNVNYDEKKSLNKKDLMRREIAANGEIDESELARRFKSRKYQKQAPVITQTVIEKAVITTDPVSIKVLSEKIGKTATDIMKKLMMLGIMKTINDSIDFATAELVSSDYGIELELKADKSAEEKLEEFIADVAEENTEPRAPIITIMGHVDHGKTSLLDRIRNTSVAAGEAGGITQHIGAYTIEKNGHMITFIDTPGHEAFTSMRARGAMVTDIAIIVVAADDGIMPQTVEAINHAKAAAVPIIVAINKIDKPGADIDRVKRELLNYDVVVGEYGGDVIACPVSAKTGAGVDDLLETINFFVLEELKPMANSKIPAHGAVIEAKVDKSGPLATILVQNGTLKIGDYMVAGSTYGKVKMMTNDKGKNVKTAGPSVPVSVLGFVEAPSAGDQMVVLQDEKLAKKIAEERKLKIKESESATNHRNVEDLFRQINEGSLKTMNLIIKADVQGSLEALVQEVTKLSNDEVKVKVIHKGVGNVNDSDMILAKTSEATIIVFNQKETNALREAATKMGVDVKWYKVIYNLLDDITLAMKGMLAPVYQETLLGKAEVREIFKITGVGVIAGCRVMEGKLQRNAKARVIRGDEIICNSTMYSLKRLKDDVKEVQSGFECGVGIEDFEEFKAGDVIECYLMEEVEPA